MIDRAFRTQGHYLLAPNVSPEATEKQEQPGETIAQLKWTATITPHLLFEVGASRTQHNVVYSYQPEVTVGTCHTAFALCPSGTGYGSISACRHAARDHESGARGGHGFGGGAERAARHVASLCGFTFLCHRRTRVQGRHAGSVRLAEGCQNGRERRSQSALSQRRALAVQILNTPSYSEGDVNADLGVYVQDTWTRKRLTLSPGVRWDYFNGSLPEQVAAAGRFVPERHFPAQDNLPKWNNVFPRLGGAYDLTGRGTTALKANIGWYVQGQGTGFAMTYSPSIVAVDQRTWTDVNRDDIAQENEIGPTSNLNFGVRRNQNPDPDISRPYQLVADVGVQHQLLPGLGLSVSYDYRRFYNTIWTTNLALNVPVDYTLLSVPDPRGNGGIAAGLQPRAEQARADQRIRREFVVEYDVVQRHGRLGELPARNLTLLGGTSTGRTLSATCDVEDPNNLRFCDQSRYRRSAADTVQARWHLRPAV